MENHFFYKKFGRIDKKAYICNVNQTVSLMLSKNVQEMIPKIQQYLASQPIEKAWLFGSCSRGEETPKSDIDLLVRYQDSDSMSLFDISRIMVNLKKIIKRPVDLIEEDCLLPFASKSANRDKILIYERKG
nr:nucleotidyltransferase domain-containing protein [Segatella hominis]